VVGGAFIDLERQLMDSRHKSSIGFGNKVRWACGDQLWWQGSDAAAEALHDCGHRGSRCKQCTCGPSRRKQCTCGPSRRRAAKCTRTRMLLCSGCSRAPCMKLAAGFI
jgi:hypothetical protein